MNKFSEYMKKYKKEYVEGCEAQLRQIHNVHSEREKFWFEIDTSYNNN